MWYYYAALSVLSTPAAPLPRKKFKKMSSSDASPIKLAIDFGFEDLMTDKVQYPCICIYYMARSGVWLYLVIQMVCMCTLECSCPSLPGVVVKFALINSIVHIWCLYAIIMCIAESFLSLLFYNYYPISKQIINESVCTILNINLQSNHFCVYKLVARLCTSS